MGYLIPIGIFAGLGLLAGVLLTVVSKIFAVKTDDRIAAAQEALPQVNCGACGFSGCNDYAEAVVTKGVACNLCKPGGEDSAKKLSEIMGVETETAEPMTAFVRCSGDCNTTVHKYDFDGIQSCAACNRFYSGSKLCTNGCMGYGDCVKVCPQGAISIVDRIAVIDPEKCIGCGLCAKECPNNLIAVRRKSQKVEVMCSSGDMGRITRNICSHGCIGCKMCERKCPTQAITVINNHAVIDYDKCINCGICVETCKVHAVNWINK